MAVDLLVYDNKKSKKRRCLNILFALYLPYITYVKVIRNSQLDTIVCIFTPFTINNVGAIPDEYRST